VDTFNIISTVDYNLIYDANSDKEDVFNMPESESKKNSSEEKYKFKINEKIPVRDGYEFLGWNIEGVELVNGDSFTMPEHDVIVKGNFKLKKYKVDFEYITEINIIMGKEWYYEFREIL